MKIKVFYNKSCNICKTEINHYKCLINNKISFINIIDNKHNNIFTIYSSEIFDIIEFSHYDFDVFADMQWDIYNKWKKQLQKHLSTKSEKQQILRNKFQSIHLKSSQKKSLLVFHHLKYK